MFLYISFFGTWNYKPRCSTGVYYWTNFLKWASSSSVRSWETGSYLSAENTWRLSVYYVGKIFRKAHISYPLIYQRLRNVSFWQKIPYYMNGPLLLLPIHCKDFEKTEIVLSKEFSWHCFEFICNKFLIHNSFFSQNKLHSFFLRQEVLKSLMDIWQFTWQVLLYLHSLINYS